MYENQGTHLKGSCRRISPSSRGTTRPLWGSSCSASDRAGVSAWGHLTGRWSGIKPLRSQFSSTTISQHFHFQSSHFNLRRMQYSMTAKRNTYTKLRDSRAYADMLVCTCSKQDKEDIYTELIRKQAADECPKVPTRCSVSSHSSSACLCAP